MLNFYKYAKINKDKKGKQVNLRLKGWAATMKHFFYRCHIQLQHPSALRVLLIEAHSSLTTVHDIIQLAFELDNDKDFQFYLGSIPYISFGFPKAFTQSNIKPLSADTLLNSLNLKSHSVLTYLYDAQKTFLFHITIEKLCSADTDSTLPRLLQDPEKVNSSSNETDSFQTLFKSEFF